jgi:transposase-like protein
LKKQYQIEKQRAVQQFRRIADEQNPNIQMILPLADIVGLLQEGVGHLVRETGLALMQTVMEEEVRHLAGDRHQQHAGRRAHRWGKEDGYCVVDGQKVPIRKTRLRTPDKREQRLGSYELFQRSGPMQLGVWDKMMRGLSTRNYGAVVKDFHNAYGIEKSAVSENFIEASREKVKQLMERPLGELRLCAMVIDGTPFKDRQMIAALGIGCDGTKTVLGIREGATENTTVVSLLLTELVERGLTSRRRGCTFSMEVKPSPQPCVSMPAKRDSSSVARFTNGATSSIICPTNTRPMCAGKCRTRTR